MPDRRSIAAPLALATLALGCGAGIEGPRHHTYAPSFNYVSEEQRQSPMWQLAASIGNLEAILDRSERPSPEERQEVLRILRHMEKVSLRLAQPGEPTEHPRFSEHVPRFRESLREAREAVEHEPPSYYEAGTVSGACLVCHGQS